MPEQTQSTETPSRTQYTYGQFTERAPITRRYLWEPVLRNLAPLGAGSRVLDAGCGNGSLAKELADRGFQVCGVDLSASGIEHARQKVPTCHFEVASVYDDFRTLFPGEFDAVVSLEVIEHLYDPRTFAKNIFNCLRPGGVVVLSTPYHGWLKNAVVAASGKHDQHYNPLYDGGHIKFWSRRTLTHLLAEQGFQRVRFEGAGRLPFLWKSMILAAER